MNARMFIESCINSKNSALNNSTINKEFFETMVHYSNQSSELYEEFHYMSPEDKNNFLKGLGSFLPFSKKIFSMFINKADKNNDIVLWIKEANDSYLNLMFECFEDTNFEENFEDIERELDALTKKLENIGTTSLLNIKNKALIGKEYKNKVLENELAIKEIQDLKEKLGSLINTRKEHKREIHDYKKEILILEDKEKVLKKELERFSEIKNNRENELENLESQQQQLKNFQKQSEAYNQDKAKLEEYEKKFENKKNTIKTLKSKVKYLNDKEIKDKLNEMDEYIDSLIQNLAPTEEEIIVYGRAK